MRGAVQGQRSDEREEQAGMGLGTGFDVCEAVSWVRNGGP